MRKWLTSLILLMVMLLVCTGASSEAEAQYFSIDTEGVISRYTGTSATVVVPSEINGIQVTAIGAGTFAGSSVEHVVIPEGVVSIGAEAFAVSTLQTVDLPDTLQTIGEGAFADCRQLASIDLPDSVLFIGKVAFGYCTSLTEVVLPENLTSVESKLFEGCIGL